MISATLIAHNWDHSDRVDCAFTAEVDGVATPVTPVSGDFTMPDGAKQLTVTATPTLADWWPATATLTIAPDGTMTVTSRGDALSVETWTLKSGSFVAEIIRLRLSRVRVVTDQIVAALGRPPQVTRPAVVPSLAGLGTSPIVGDALKLADVASLVTIDPQDPVSEGMLAFNTVANASLKNDTFVVEVAGVTTAPRTIAVSWPDAVPRDAPSPMFVFFRQTCRQNLGSGLFEGAGLEPYPYSFDYAFFGLLQNLWFPVSPDQDPFNKGIPFQISAAGKNVVTIVACNRVSSVLGGEFGDWTDAAFMQSILLEIQALAAANAGVDAPVVLGRVALGSFSSGNYYLSNLLANHGDTIHPFLTATVKECYFFDPDDIMLRDGVARMLNWQKNVVGGDGIIRLYNHTAWPEQKPLLGTLVTKSPHFTDSSTGRITVSVETKEDWTASLSDFHNAPVDPPWDFQLAHHASASFMLVHAMAHSGF